MGFDVTALDSSEHLPPEDKLSDRELSRSGATLLRGVVSRGTMDWLSRQVDDRAGRSL